MLVIEDKDITLDLNGHTLDRNLDAADADGHAIIVRSNAILYLTSNSDKKAMITGGFANNGGAINNKGILYVDNVAFKLWQRPGNAYKQIPWENSTWYNPMVLARKTQKKGAAVTNCDAFF